ncbi:hypothetical protein SDC9_145133 [bioreactor metagenome]|uniref:Uncharacterized protein n=1 Tax=bioreactor metagenome TaxID=1076179 RepID=A0A645EBB6_9ZZZZ
MINEFLNARKVAGEEEKNLLFHEFFFFVQKLHFVVRPAGVFKVGAYGGRRGRGYFGVVKERDVGDLFCRGA